MVVHSGGTYCIAEMHFRGFYWRCIVDVQLSGGALWRFILEVHIGGVQWRRKVEVESGGA